MGCFTVYLKIMCLLQVMQGQWSIKVYEFLKLFKTLVTITHYLSQLNPFFVFFYTHFSVDSPFSFSPFIIPFVAPQLCYKPLPAAFSPFLSGGLSHFATDMLFLLF